jgi:DNA polymerase-3 subunit gamma/tau
VDILRQAWPNVIDAIKAKGRVAAIVVGNASVASFDEGVLTLRFPRQGDVKGFVGSRYEDLLKQALNAMFGVNVGIRAITGGGDAPPTPARRQGPGPGPSAPFGQAVQPGPGQPGPGQPGPGQSAYGQSSAGYPQPQVPAPPAASQAAAPPAPSVQTGTPGGGDQVTAGPTANIGGGYGSNHGPLGEVGMGGAGDLPPLPPPPQDEDDDYFDPDDEDMSSSTTVNDLTGMALIQRELGAQIIAEYDE